MRRFIIKIENLGGLLYSGYAYGRNENEALIKLLNDENILLSSGDIISIEELPRPKKMEWED